MAHHSTTSSADSKTNNNNDNTKDNHNEKEKPKLKEIKRKKFNKKHKKKSNKSSDSRNDKIIKEQQKISTEWMKISKEKDRISTENIKLKKEKLKNEKELKQIQNLYTTWKNESNELLKQIEEKYSQFESIIENNGKKSQIKSEINNDINQIYNISFSESKNETKNESDKSKLQRLQKAAKEAQKRAEKTLSELYRKKQELKQEQLQLENDRLKFKRMENEYNQFIKEKKKLKKEKTNLLKTQKSLMVTTTKKSRMKLTEEAELEYEKEQLVKTKNVLQHKNQLLSRHQYKQSVNNLNLTLSEQREYKDLKKKVCMYQDKIDELENTKKILQRKIAKRDRFASDYIEDNNFGTKNLKNVKYLISTLRSKVIEYENRNKLLTKLIKKHKVVTDAYNNISDLRLAKKVITKLVIENEQLNKRLNIYIRKLQQMKDLSDKYQTHLYSMYDDEDDENEQEEIEEKEIFDDELYNSMKHTITELKSNNEQIENKLQDKETELSKYESYANEWDIQNRLGEDRGKALYAKLRIENEKLKNKLDIIYSKWEKDKAEEIMNELQQQNTITTTDEDLKQHKAITMDINEQFGSGLFNNLQYILMDADLNDDKIIKFKIKDKNEQIYEVVLMKQNENENANKNENIVKPIVTQQKNMINTLDNINNIINGYDETIQRLTNMLSARIIINKKRGFIKTRKLRSDSIESLDSVYDLSHEDSLTKYGRDIHSRISQFNSITTAASLYYPTGNNFTTESKKGDGEEQDTQKLTRDDVSNIFNYYDKDQNGTISVQELICVFQQLGIDTSDNNKLNEIIKSLDVNNDGVITRNNFIEWWFSSDQNMNAQFDSSIRSLLFLTTNNDNFQGQKSDELHAFAQYLNRIFNDLDSNDLLLRYFPIDTGDGGHDLLSKCVDGVLLSKIINFSVPNIIDERVLHFRDNKTDNILPKQIVENLNIVLSSCKAIGIDLKLEEISVEKFLDPSHYEDIIRQILSELSKIHLSKKINLKDNPVLIRLIYVYEDDDMIKSLTTEQWLKRWINYQLKRSGEDKRIKSFGKDFRDGLVLSLVLHSITKRKKKKSERFDLNKALSQPVYARCHFLIRVLQQQFNMKQVFVAANDILSGNSRLICLLCAQIFDKFTGMKRITKQELQQVNDLYNKDKEGDDDGNKQQENDKLQNNKVSVNFAKDKPENENNNKYKTNWDVHKGRKKHTLPYKSKTINNNNSEELNNININNDNDKKEEASSNDNREERDIVNWINEIFFASKLKQYKITNLSRDIKDGLILLHFIDLICSTDIVKWDKDVIIKPLNRQQCLTNCHYIISLIKNEPFISSFFDIESIPNDGNCIYDPNKEIIFKICHNLINYYYIKTISQLLTYKITEFDMIHWTNEQLQKNKQKYPRFCSYDEKKLHSFSDETLKSCLYYIDLLLILMDDPRNDINRNIVIHKNNRQNKNDYTKQECLSNARYALSIARKFGAVFYISEYDLVNVKSPEITMSFIMCIMLLILNKNNNKPVEIHTLQNHLQEQKNTSTNSSVIDDNESHTSASIYINDEELNKKQNTAQKHGRKRSVLAEYGIITDNAQLQELQIISRNYSTPNIVTPKVPTPQYT